MSVQQIASLVAGRWTPPGLGARPVASAITGEVIGEAGNDGLDMGEILAHARGRGGPALRSMTFHQRAAMLKALAGVLNDAKDKLYELSYDTGATKRDHAFDIDGGIGTLFVYSSKGRRELPDARVLVDGGTERFGREGSFLGQHVATPLTGAAVHINAFNFPLWGMLEKLAPTWLAGMPAIVKPATATAYVTEYAVRLMAESGHLPEGALQMIAGGTGDLLDQLDGQDVVAFTGSADTALRLRANRALLANSVRFTAEQDSLNASILGPDAGPDSPEFDLFLKEAIREVTTKAGQKCTAMRRLLVPRERAGEVADALRGRLAGVTVGDPRRDDVRMGALVSTEQRRDVLEKVGVIADEAERVFGDPDAFDVIGADAYAGAFVPPMLFHCADPDGAARVHDTEAFGPVTTIMGYRDLDHAISLANRGQGSLVASVFTHDPEVAQKVILGAGAQHGRLYFNNRDSAGEATGHGAPMPHMIHGGPGRAGGGEELGGIRGVLHYMQRTAVQGSPAILAAITGRWLPGAPREESRTHPFQLRLGELSPGLTITTEAREVTLDDIEHFAHFTGDTFYAHMDEEAAKRNPFFPGRVAHGYLVLSFAAGLFVEPNEGPVLANTGLDNLRFTKPVSPGSEIHVELTVKEISPRSPEYGEVRWQVAVIDEAGDRVAGYELLTMNAV